jgi:hypothetical protein
MRKPLSALALCLILFVLLSLLWIFLHGERSHRGTIPYLRWKYGAGPYQADVVAPLIRHDRGLKDEAKVKSEAWFRARFPELDPPCFGEDRHARKEYGTPSSQVLQIRGSDTFVVIDRGIVIALTTIKGT